MKMQRIIKYFGTILPMAILMSCEKIIEPGELPEQDARLVVNSILNSDSVVTAQISSSKSIVSGKDYKMIDNADCELFEDGNFIEKLLNKKDGNYRGNTIPKPGKKYTIKVSAAGYKSVEGESAMTLQVVVKKTERFDSLNSFFRRAEYSDQTNVSYVGEVKIRTTLIDNPQTKNYYGIKPFMIVYDTSGAIALLPEEVNLWAYNTNGDATNSYNWENFVTTDDEGLVNGNELNFSIAVSISYLQLVQNQIGKIEIYFQISHLSEDYFLYHKTFSKQAGAGPNWFAEPALVYNNVKNGMGIVGCISNTVMLVYSGKPNN